VPIGNSLYPKWDQNVSRIAIDNNIGNKHVVFGHYQSTRLTKIGPTLLVDRSATAFYGGGSLMSFLAKQMNQSEDQLTLSGDRDIKQMMRELKGLYLKRFMILCQ